MAKLFGRVKYNDSIDCGTKPRIENQTVGSINPHAIGMSSTVKIPYIQCTSLNKNKFYEFKFNNVDGTKDSANRKDFMSGICSIFGSKYKDYKTTENRVDVRYDVCEDIKTQQDCEKINAVLEGSDLGVHSMWYGGDYQYAEHYCILRDNNVFRGSSKELDGMLIESTAFGLDNRVFLKAGISRKGSKEIKAQIRTYVENSIGKENVKSFKCEDNYHSGKLQDTHKKADMLVCYVNGEEITFMFNDLSTVWGTYDKSGREAMNCIAWGGTFTGKKCIGLDEQQCYKVRDANAASCPECKQIKWDSKTRTCNLPSSVDATHLKRGLTYSAIVGGAAVSVAITVGTAGVGGVTAGTAIIMLVETAGAGIELGAQINIDNKADKFFVSSANCHSQSCAEELVQKYLIELARIGGELSDVEADAIDKEMERLIGLISTNSSWWRQYLRTDDGKSLLDKADDKKWTVAQVWRAVGIGMQFAGVASSVTGWIIKNTKYFEVTLDRTSRILLRNAKIAEKNIVKVEELDDVGKEWYKLWQEYAPKNQTLDEFKEMADGDLNKMKEMAKDWTSRSKKPIINAQLDKQINDATEELNRRAAILRELEQKYGQMPADPVQHVQILEYYPDVKEAEKNFEYAQSELKKLENAREYYNNTSYSTFDPEFSRISKEAQKKLDDNYDQIVKEWKDYFGKHPSATAKDFEETDMYKHYVEQRDAIKRDYNFEVAETFPLKNLGNVVNERADDFAEIIATNPEIKAKLDPENWQKLTEAENGQADALIEKLAEDPTIKSKLSPNWQKLGPYQRRQEMAQLVETDSDVQRIVAELRSTKSERTAIVQQIVDGYAQKTATQAPDISSDYLTTAVGYYRSGTNEIALNPYEQFRTSGGMVEATAHEHGHFIDNKAPNEGALGEQFSRQSDPLYSNKTENGYRIALTEQSSFKIGPNVSHKATGTTDAYNAKEYDLEKAKLELEVEQLQNKYNKAVYDKNVDKNSTIIGTGAAATAAGIGGLYHVIDKTNK